MICYVLDEHQRRQLWRAIRTHNSKGANPIDALRVGGPADLPLGTLDPALLLWCERSGRILVSEDVTTLPSHLADHLRSGQHSPGIFVIRVGQSLSAVVDFLAAAAYASDPDEWRDAIWFIP
jgi:hypothetical protein